MLAITLAHAVGEDAVHGPWYTAWNPDPLILPCLGLVAVAYTLGIRTLWRRAGVGHGITGAQAGAFFLGMLVLFVALVSPIDVLASERASIHMGQHMLIMLAAAPLLILGMPSRVLLFALPRFSRSRLGAALCRMPGPYLLWQPLLMWALYALTLWVWHLPTLYEAALHHEPIHDAQHLAFLVTACLFWRVLIDPLSRRRLNLGLGMLYLFTASLQASALGVFLALSPRLWYRAYATPTQPWQLTPLEDQQLAGLIMWMPGCVLYAAVAALMCYLWINRLQANPHRRRAALHAGSPTPIPNP
ncbi:MAG: cytochrome c oxidase assembly protein [Phycisphaeraceae bacterium]